MTALVTKIIKAGRTLIKTKSLDIKTALHGPLDDSLQNSMSAIVTTVPFGALVVLGVRFTVQKECACRIIAIVARIVHAQAMFLRLHSLLALKGQQTIKALPIVNCTIVQDESSDKERARNIRILQEACPNVLG